MQANDKGGKMKIIKAYVEPVCRVLCSTCDEGEYLDVERVRNYSNSDNEVLFLSFINRIDFSFFTRFKKVASRIVNLKKYKNSKQYVTSITLELEQLGETYGAILDSCLNKGILNKDDLDYINKFDNFLPLQCDNNFDGDLIIFESKERFVFSMITSKNITDNMINYFEFGWVLPSDLKLKTIIRSGLRYLFGKSRIYFDEYSLTLYKPDLVELLANINYVINHIKNIDGHNYL